MSLVPCTADSRARGISLTLVNLRFFLASKCFWVWVLLISRTILSLNINSKVFLKLQYCDNAHSSCPQIPLIALLEY